MCGEEELVENGHIEEKNEDFIEENLKLTEIYRNALLSI
jgi:hypothetical protein